MISKFLARQLGAPSAVIGPLVLAWLWNRRNRALNDVVFERLALAADDAVLEVGFGGGYLLGRVLGVVTGGAVAGIDVSEAMTGACRRRYRTHVQNGRLDLRCTGVEAIPFETGRFNTVYSVNTIFYWSDVIRGLTECRRVLQRGGRLVLCFTDRASLEHRGFARHGLALFDGQQVEAMLTDSGFMQIESFMERDRYREYWVVSGVKPDGPN